MLVGFEEATFFVEESAVILLYQLHIWGWLERDVTVDIRTTNGTAIRKSVLVSSLDKDNARLGLFC